MPNKLPDVPSTPRVKPPKASAPGAKPPNDESNARTRAASVARRPTVDVPARRGSCFGQSMTDVARKRVLVTGAARGLGLLVGERLAKRGAEMTLWDVDRERLRAAAQRIGVDRVEHEVVDVSDRSAVESAARAMTDRRGPLDILINNAGIVSGKALLELEPREVERTMQVNVLAHFWTLRAFLPSMVERDAGHVVTIASAAGICAVPRLADYSASKFAVFGLDEALRLELRRLKSRVRTTVVCPYFVDTGMFLGVRTRRPLLLPILHAERVADRVVDAILHDQERLILPWTVRLTWLFRLLPTTWFDTIPQLFGLDRSMDDFVGHTGGSPFPNRPGRVPGG